ncbi:nucleotidyltransferase domain-containing protein [Pyxidicoccus xibeiensis]|uniref:nucleotidyltransferase domain-containing protein n=1 Tax=Pyxidicoccus xibeiensis TaxID=2906759 RepID=UPI0020A70B75|nr:nucleotidyltransferase domain-containing protein [Pyxidicoccus xibeiensis]MCP3142816.1 nucleotidyltransferase domain-containing protein [Pyxidicoccus xibeiensis]
MLDEDLPLVGMTESLHVNSALFGFVSLSRLVFPRRIRACYLLGSHATSEAVEESDVDLTVVFKDRFQPGERERCAHFRQALAGLTRIPLDLTVVDEAQLLEEGEVKLKRASLLVAGEDIRDQVPTMSPERWLRYCMHGPYFFMERGRARGEGEPLRYPLGPPDPNGEFHGYDFRETLDAKGQLYRGFKELVALATWLAASAVARTGRSTASTREAFAAHREYVNDAWTPLFTDIYACRERWGYRLPEAREDREHLRALCARMVDAENHFLAGYREYLLTEVRRGALADRLLAVQRLGDILYPDDEVRAALESLTGSPEDSLREAAREALRKRKQYGAPPTR